MRQPAEFTVCILNNKFFNALVLNKHDDEFISAFNV